METFKWDIYEAWMNAVEGIGRQKMKRLQAGGCSFLELYKMDRNSLHNYMIKTYQTKIGEDGSGIARAISKTQLEKDIEAIERAKKGVDPFWLYEMYEREKIYYVNYKNKEYPSKLAEIPDAPYAFYRKGDAFPFEKTKPVIAIVGARACSEYGKYVANQLGMLAATLGFEVVSGLASGVDGIAQNAARIAGGEVTAVLGCGVDICYPRENKKIYERILEKGRLISEYPPKTQPVAQNFPPRNRIIAGLCDALIVVEAKKKSGTLITVDMALEQGREVYVIPGRVTDPMSFGCNNLIAQGAQIVVDITQILGEIKNKSLHNVKNKEGTEAIQDDQKGWFGLHKTNVSGLEQKILDCLEVSPKSLQELYELIQKTTPMTLADLQNTLLEMELMGLVLELAGIYQKSSV